MINKIKIEKKKKSPVTSHLFFFPQDDRPVQNLQPMEFFFINLNS